MNSSPSFTDWDTGEKRSFVKVSMTDTHAFAPSSSTSVLLECQGVVEDNLSESRCRPANVGRHDTGAGVMSSFGSAVISSAGVVGGAYFMGKGLSDSGDRSQTTNTMEIDSPTDVEIDQSYTNEGGYDQRGQVKVTNQ